ncbi:MAG: DNA-binding response regulator, partial [Armatimonadetes bacterium]|nr:DNA-binding response regulator [Armatimonadota bacterium]
GYHYGADMYLTKPFNPRELVTFVKRIAEGGGDDDDGGPKKYDI